MSTIGKQTTKEIDKINSMAIGVLITVLVFGIYTVGYDQGQLFSLVQGQKAFDIRWMHEFYHDMRHVAGFPCH
jgi:putative cobalt transporter subunit CbtB